MKIIDIINRKFEEWILIVLLVAIVLIVNAQVISRYTIHYDMSWSFELSRYIFIWIAWMSVSYVIQHNAHIRVELLKDKLKGRKRDILELFMLFVFFIFAATLVVVGTQYVQSTILTGEMSPTLDFPVWITYIVIPLSGLLMCIRLIQQAILIFRQ